MSNSEEYIKQLEETIRRFLEPIKDIHYNIAIRSLTGCRVLEFDRNDKKNKKLLNKLKEAAQISLKTAYRKGIKTKRPNEAGNQIEPFVINSLNKVGLKAEKPKSRKGKIKIAGYPDIEISDEYGRTIYLECKTYSALTKGQSFRTFYFSPSKDPKITKDAFHLLLSFELSQRKRKKGPIFVPVSWQLYTLENLKVQIRYLQKGTSFS